VVDHQVGGSNPSRVLSNLSPLASGCVTVSPVLGEKTKGPHFMRAAVQAPYAAPSAMFSC